MNLVLVMVFVFLLNVDRRVSGFIFLERWSLNGRCYGWIIVGNVCSFGSSIIVDCYCCCCSVRTFGRGEGSKRAKSDWWAVAGGGGGGVEDVTLENEHVRAGGRGGGRDGPVRARFELAEKSFVDKIFVVPKEKLFFSQIFDRIKIKTIFWSIESYCSHTFKFSMNFFKCWSFIWIPSPT